MRHGHVCRAAGAVPRRRAWLLLAPLLALVAPGCLFEPRTAETPGGVTVQYVPQTEPKAVMENLDKAIMARDASGYLRQISENFRYVPDGQTTTDYPGIDWLNWGYGQEQTFVTALFNNISAAEASLRAVVIFAEPASGTSVEWEFIYALQVTGGGSSSKYRGRAKFTLALEGPFWYLTKWEDTQGEADPGGGATLATSGALRGAITGGGG